MSDPSSPDSELPDDCALTDDEVDELIESRVDLSTISVDRDEHISRTRRAIESLKSESDRKIAPSAEMAALFASSGTPVLSVVAPTVEPHERDAELDLAGPTVSIDAKRQASARTSPKSRAWLRGIAVAAAVLIPLVLLSLRSPTGVPPVDPPPAEEPTALPTRPEQLPAPVPTMPPTPTPNPTPLATPTPTVDADATPTDPSSDPEVRPTPAVPQLASPDDPSTDAEDSTTADDTQQSGDEGTTDSPSTSLPTDPATGNSSITPGAPSSVDAQTPTPTPSTESATFPEIPTIEIPTIEIPQIEIPTIEIPTIEIPQIEIPTRQPIPTIEIPQIEIPTRQPIPTPSF